MKRPLKIVILGDSGVGKTCILSKYVQEEIGVTQPIVGVDLHVKKILIDDNVVTLQIWGLSGRYQFDFRTKKHYQGAHCCVLVYDITSQASFDSLVHWFGNFIKNAGSIDP